MRRSDTVISSGNFQGDDPYKQTVNGEEIDYVGYLINLYLSL
jgi:hypothetical protein